MTADRGKTLARLHRVRTVQLNLAHADEARARDHVSSETQLHARIAQLADEIAPIATNIAGVALGAAAHYRDRLHQSALTAAGRLQQARDQEARATAATRAARRDQNAIEKLIARADSEAIRRQVRALEDAPLHARKRHDPC